MAIDYSFKLLIDMYWLRLLEFLKGKKMVNKFASIELLGPSEVVIQERPLRIDYAFRLDNNFLLLEVKSENDILNGDDMYRLMLYALGIGKRYNIPLHELKDRVSIIVLAPSRKNLRVDLEKLRPGIYRLKAPINITALCVEEVELDEDVMWMGIISSRLRRKLLDVAVRKRNLKILGILYIIDRELRSLIMSEWRELLEEALRELGETIGYGNLLQILAGDSRKLEEALRELGETIGFDKLMDIIITMLKKVDSNLIRKLKDRLEKEL